MPKTLQSIAFWVFAETTVELKLQEECMLQHVELDGNRRPVRRDSGLLPQGASSRILLPGIHGFLFAHPISFSITKGKAEFAMKGGKDPWPLPPPPVKAEFEEVRLEDWEAGYKTIFLCVADDPRRAV